MKAITENIPKTRGRPCRVFISALHRSYIKGVIKGRTDRSARNWMHFVNAAKALGNGSERQFFYLLQNGRERWRVTILTELGMFGDRQTIRKVARVICREKRPTAVTVAWLRSVRGTTKQTTINELMMKLAKDVDEWMDRKGGTRDGALMALRGVTELVAEG